MWTLKKGSFYSEGTPPRKSSVEQCLLKIVQLSAIHMAKYMQDRNQGIWCSICYKLDGANLSNFNPFVQVSDDSTSEKTDRHVFMCHLCLPQGVNTSFKPHLLLEWSWLFLIQIFLFIFWLWMCWMMLPKVPM